MRCSQGLSTYAFTPGLTIEQLLSTRTPENQKDDKNCLKFGLNTFGMEYRAGAICDGQ